MRIGLTLLLFGALAAEARADVPPFPSPRRTEPGGGGIRWPWEKRTDRPVMPKPAPPPPSFRAEPFGVELLGEDEGVQPVLQVTPNFYKALRKIAMGEAASDDRTVVETAPQASPYRWAAAGAALALGLATGGLWLRKSGNGRALRFALLMSLTGTAAFGGAAIMATPPLMPKPPSEMKAQPIPLPIENRLRVELLDERNDAVRIKVSRAYLEKLLDARKPVPAPRGNADGPVLPPPPSAFPGLPK